VVLPRERRALLTVRAFTARIRTWGLKESFRSKKTPSQRSGPVASRITCVPAITGGLLAIRGSARFLVKWISSSFAVYSDPYGPLCSERVNPADEVFRPTLFTEPTGKSAWEDRVKSSFDVYSKKRGLIASSKGLLDIMCKTCSKVYGRP
jgi:hypothetical protein